MNLKSNRFCPCTLSKRKVFTYICIAALRIKEILAKCMDRHSFTTMYIFLCKSFICIFTCSIAGLEVSSKCQYAAALCSVGYYKLTPAAVVYTLLLFIGVVQTTVVVLVPVPTLKHCLMSVKCLMFGCSALRRRFHPTRRRSLAGSTTCSTRSTRLWSAESGSMGKCKHAVLMYSKQALNAALV